ncbi:uncharacterized protein J4E78_004224 [Alternaria triticimaculans]|uniref:uncharacterized protein n=1 Tax=Alternaria triticimaculans TaxID=297637 RepID=UPI0020C47F88|nr:uncharacterized protein J4E78_004224 [Alternaria triticimaculans]KAI4663805.1 hypothetical protein J4E78_004224 [Alternaria triticimaculans]
MDPPFLQKKDIKPATQPAKDASQLLLEDISAIRTDIQSLAQRFDRMERNIKTADKSGLNERLTSFTKAVAVRNRDGNRVRAEAAGKLTKELREEEEKMEESAYYWFRDLREWLKKGLANVEETEKRSHEHLEGVSKRIDAVMDEQE